MQQQPPFVTLSPPSKKPYLLKGLMYVLIGAALIGLSLYLNVIDTSTSGHLAFVSLFGCLSGFAFVVGLIFLFAIVPLVGVYRRMLLASQFQTRLTRQEAAESLAEAAREAGLRSFLSNIVAVIGWYYGSGNFPRTTTLRMIMTGAAFYALARGLLNLDIKYLLGGIVFLILGFFIRFLTEAL